MKLSSQKYLETALKWLLPFLLLEALLCVLFFTGIAEWGLFAILSVINIFCLLLPGAYYLTALLVLRQKSAELTLREGVIENWEAGFFRYTGSVIIKENGREYATSATFSSTEAKELVGKRVSFAIFGDTLLLHEIKETP